MGIGGGRASGYTTLKKQEKIPSVLNKMFLNLSFFFRPTFQDEWINRCYRNIQKARQRIKHQLYICDHCECKINNLKCSVISKGHLNGMTKKIRAWRKTPGA